ncbi:MAG: HAD family hydrolase [Deltaproteobacteria bacterium]|nr:HAD family hydrolase [Deltaproteobacteria bacterium]
MIVSREPKIYDSLIFDLDGTLWDSTSACASAWNTALKKIEIERETPLTPEDIGRMMGFPIAKIFENFFPDMSEERRESAAKACFKEQIEIIRQKGAILYPGVQKGLFQLSEKYQLFIVSNCQQIYLDTFFHHSGLKKLFKDTECHGNTKRPKGENIGLVVKRNSLQKPVYVGDTAGDHESAVMAGVPYFHVNYGFGITSKPCMKFDNFEELVRHFLEPWQIS